MGKYQDDMSQEKKPSGMLPAGERVVMVTDLEDTVAKSGNKMFIATVEDVVTGESQKVYLVNEPKKRWMLKALLDACNVPKSADGKHDWSPEDVLGKKIACMVTHYQEPWITREGKEVMLNKANVKDFYPITELNQVEDKGWTE